MYRIPALWNKYFGQLLLLVLEALRAQSSGIREGALVTIRALVINLGDSQFVDYIDVVIARLLDCVRDESRLVAQVQQPLSACLLDVPADFISHPSTQRSEEALEALITTVTPPQRCLQVLIPIIKEEESPVLQAAIR